ncbi:MAG: hypothetical protein IKL26_02280 [Bacteroidales bacterium]|nr:hypothetical protein [Bacteroidales bacterium]
MEKRFIRIHSIQDIIISSSLVVIGLALIIIPTGVGVSIAGIFVIIMGIVLALTMKRDYKDRESGERYKKIEQYFPQAMRGDLLRVIENNPERISLPKENKEDTLKMDIYYNRKCDKAFIQLFEYVPYQYNECSKMYEHKLNKIINLIK